MLIKSGPEEPNPQLGQAPAIWGRADLWGSGHPASASSISMHEMEPEKENKSSASFSSAAQRSCGLLSKTLPLAGSGAGQELCWGAWLKEKKVLSPHEPLTDAKCPLYFSNGALKKEDATGSVCGGGRCVFCALLCGRVWGVVSVVRVGVACVGCR